METQMTDLKPEIGTGSARPSSDRWLFILGCDRSGTTLVQNLLSTLSKLHLADSHEPAGAPRCGAPGAGFRTSKYVLAHM